MCDDISSTDSSVAFTKGHVRVIVASSLGTLFEWYDFAIIATLTPYIAKHFYSALPNEYAFIMALFTFSAGLILRPFGAVLFGHVGDKIGRKYSFLITIIIMGLSTFLIGLLPTYESIGLTAPILLLILRCLQGLAVGGEYGGAATYLAEHAPAGKRGFYTGFLQATSDGASLLCTLVVIFFQAILGKEHFELWGWRIPFLLSIILLVFSIFIRMKLKESPIFAKLKNEGKQSKVPLKETFCDLKNLRLIFTVLFGAVAGQAVVSYACSLYMYYFLIHTLKIDLLTVNLIFVPVLCFTMSATFTFGWLSDKIGRKPLVMTGLILSAIILYPICMGFTHFGNPELEVAMKKSPVVVIVDPKKCSFQFVPSELKAHVKFTSYCDILKTLLNDHGVSYSNEGAPKEALAKVKIGNLMYTSPNITGLTEDESKIEQSKFKNETIKALLDAGYPLKANPSKVNIFMLILLWSVLQVIGTLAYGPLAAWSVELFPTKIRYTSISLPYHIGNGWFGGFVPTIGFAIVIYSGNIYSGLLYPIIIALISFFVGLLFLKETKNVDLTKE